MGEKSPTVPIMGVAALKLAFLATAAEPSRRSEKKNSQMFWYLEVVKVPPNDEYVEDGPNSKPRKM